MQRGWIMFLDTPGLDAIVLINLSRIEGWLVAGAIVGGAFILGLLIGKRPKGTGRPPSPVDLPEPGSD